MMRRPSSVQMLLVLALVLGSAPATARVLARVSVSTGGEPGNDGSRYPFVSNDGRYVAFQSLATNLVAGDTNDEEDVFVHDRTTGQTTRVNVSSAGAEANGQTMLYGLSDDGRLVLFGSGATNLVPGDPYGWDLFIHDCASHETERMPRPPDQGYGIWRCNHAITGDGRYVLMADKVFGDGGLLGNYWVVSVHDRQLDTLAEVFRSSAVTHFDNLTVSADGRFVSCQMKGIAGDNGYWQAYVYDRQTAGLERVSVSTSGETGEWDAYWPSISADGRFVVFESVSRNLVAGDTNDKNDVFIRDRQTAQTERVSVSSSEEQASDDSFCGVMQRSVSTDGRFVTFYSWATNLVAGDTGAGDDVFVRDRQTGETIRVSVDAAGTEADGASCDPCISVSGGFVAFWSTADNLVPGGSSPRIQVFLAQNPSLNAAPSQPTVDVTPDAPDTNDDLACAITEESTDPDEDPITYSYGWYKDDVQQSAYDDLTTVPASATAPGETWKCVVTPNDGTQDGPSGEDQVTIGEPQLDWAGTPGYESDGVDPDIGDPQSTTFTFKVKYTDPTGDAPTKARVIISRLTADGWVLYRNLGLTLESGDVATGALYSCETLVPNFTLKYVFMFKAGDGSPVDGPPTVQGDGPLIIGRPCVAWPSQVGYESDGVEPDSGPLGTSFQFRVKYYDSAGDAPATCDLVLRRNGHGFRCKAMLPLPTGDLRLGQVYRTWVLLDKPGVYEYRFHFADASGNALGPPNNFASGPLITEGSGDAMVSSLTALPTVAGAQITFSLSASANVTATVVNVAGRPIAAIAVDKPLEAGLQTLLWNRTSTTGLSVPSGVYLIRVTARADDGSQSSALGTVSLR